MGHPNPTASAQIRNPKNQTMDDLITSILRDLQVELSDEFDRNFQRGAFFNEVWPAKRSGGPSHLVQTGKLRRSIQSVITGNRLKFTSSEPYAAIHNEGGEITVTERMKKYFWAKFKQTGQQHWKYLALVKTGSKITIPKRQFLGSSPEVERAIERVIDDNVRDYLSNLNFK